MKDYYSILGVSPTAHAGDIKRAYRKLVQQLHPDINPDPQAAELIKAVNEAYDVLGDPVKRSTFDNALRNPFSTLVEEETPPHRDRAYRRRAAYPPRQKQGPTQRDMMEWTMPYLRNVWWAGCLVCLVLLVDFLLPRNFYPETIIRFRTRELRGGVYTYFITDKGRSLSVAQKDFQQLGVGDELILEETPWVGVLVGGRTSSGSVLSGNLGTLYGNFVFVPVLLLISSVLGVSKIGSLEFRFNLGVVSVFVLIFTLVLMF
jgi:hypothetical protein